MSRTILTMLTAAGLATVSVLIMAGRYHVLGDEILVPSGPNIWKVTMKVNGISLAANARLQTLTPLDFGRQHIKRESCHSDELLDKPPSARHPDRRGVLWTPRPGVGPGHFHAYYEFYCLVDVHRPSVAMERLASQVDAAPKAGEQIKSEARIEASAASIAALARTLTTDRGDPADQAESLFHFVDREVANEPNPSGPVVGAADCLKEMRGDAGAKSRLLIALCRNRGIPARLVTGIHLVKNQTQKAHFWAEAWVHDHWLPMCPFNHHFGHVPPTYLVLGFGDQAIVRGKRVRDLSYAYLIERTAPDEAMTAVEPTGVRRWLKDISLDALQPAEQRMVEFLLLLPIAALIVCVGRNIIGVTTFGTFAPALVGLAFREVQSIPGILVFVSVVLLGWGMRRVLDQYHLLQVPRTAFMLSLVVLVLLMTVVAANCLPQPIEATKYIPLFPLVILTGMIERFWTLETEDSASASFRTLLGTMAMAALIALCLSWRRLVNHMFLFPETLGFVMACQLLIGRYTGYRLTELFRFKDFISAREA